MRCQVPGLSGVKTIVLGAGSFGKFLGTIERTANGGQQRMYSEYKREYFQENRIWMSTPTLTVIQASRLELIDS